MKIGMVHLAVTAGLAFVAGMALAAVMANAPDSLDAATAAPQNHRVLFEDGHVRLLEVTIQPGETESFHRHAAPSVFGFDVPMPKITNRIKDGPMATFDSNFNLVGSDGPLPPEVVKMFAEMHGRLEAGVPQGMPVALAMGPEPTHQIHNLDSFPVHFYRLEFKRVEGNSIKQRKTY